MQISFFEQCDEHSESDGEKINEAEHPYLIEPTARGTYLVKHGRYRQSLYGGNVHWTRGKEYATLCEAVRATTLSVAGGEATTLV